MLVRIQVIRRTYRTLRCRCARCALGGIRAVVATIEANTCRVFHVLTILVANRADAVAPVVRLSYS